MGDFYSRRQSNPCEPDEEPKSLLQEEKREPPVKLASTIHTSASYRPDIDGLRGFGALLVIWFHFRETWNNSPYKGADLTNSTFFAVSGFVITLSVLRARARNPVPIINASNTGGFAVIFLCRRLQRLVMTQLFVTFITMSIFLATLYPGPRLLGIIRTAQYSVIGGANIYFGTRKEKISYISATVTDTSLAKNPLMHTWYLGVEEQVYLLYPWIFAVAHLYAARSKQSPYYVFGVVFLASFTCAVMADANNPSSFFLLQYRGWEVIVGVLICHALMYSKCFGGIKTKDGSILRNNVLYWPQLSFVVLESVALWLFQYPKYSLISTIFALAGTAVFFISGHGYNWNLIYSQSTSRKIDFRSEVPLLNYFYGLTLHSYVGRLSYAMYLWHFPVAVLCADFKEEIQQLIGTTDTVAFSLQLLLITMVSIFTHHMVENPFRWWKPSNQYLPALCILILAAGIEIWLYGIMPQVVKGAHLNILDINMLDGLLPAPPIFSTAKLAFLVTATAVAPALVMAIRLPKTCHCNKSTTTTLSLWLIIPLCLFLYENSLRTQQPLISAMSTSTTKGNAGNLPLGTSVDKNESTFWNWGGGTHSFASFGCACHHVGNARAPPGASSSDTMLPLCYDTDHWNDEHHFAYGEDDKRDECTIGFGAEQIHRRNDVSLTADEIWKLCREPGRLKTESTPTAFVVGGSTSVRLRVAVANAVGGEFSVLGYGIDLFNEPEHFKLLDTTDGIGMTNKIHFDRDSARKKTSSQTNENKLRELGKKLQYVERVGQLLDQHLGKGDLLFLTWKPPSLEIKEKKAKIKEQLAGFIRLGKVLHSRGATLVLTTGHLHNMPKESAKNGFMENSTSFLDRQKRYERLLQDASAQAPGKSIVHWPLGEQFCGDTTCSRMIAGTNELIGNIHQPSGMYDWWHPSIQAEAFLSPFLCSFLDSHKLLSAEVKKPEEYKLEFLHDIKELDMTEIRAGADQFVFKLFRLPTHLQLSAVTAFVSEYEPLSHKNIVHHSALYACTEFPKQAKALEESFSTPNNPSGNGGLKKVCGRTIWTQGMEGPPIEFPLSSENEQMAVFVDTEYVLLELHYKAPEADENDVYNTGIVSDNSGLSATFISQKEASQLGTTFKYIQMTIVGPQLEEMLTLPPGRDQIKITSACPRECFKEALESENKTKVEIVGYLPHAHFAATAAYGEVLHHNQKKITPISVTPNFTEYIEQGEEATFLSQPVEITADDTVKFTCVYNTKNRTQVTTLGINTHDEMCMMILLISPPVRDFDYCWHKPAQEPETDCVAKCGGHSYPSFSLPRDNTNWSWSDPSAQKALGDAYPSSPVCEV